MRGVVMNLSVVMATYNGEKYIENQLESLRSQRRVPDEVIILDDNSTDDTLVIVKQFIKKYKLINWKVVSNERNQGWRRNFMNGIWQSEGDLIFPCDQDDIWHADKLEVMEKIMSNNSQINVLVSNHKNFYDNGVKKIAPCKNTNHLSKIPLKNNCMAVEYPGCTYCIRKNLALLSKKYYRDGYAHDDLMWRLGLFSESLYVLKKDLIDYRQHDDSTYSLESARMKTIAEKKKWIQMTQNFCVDLERFVENENLSSKIKMIRKLRKVQLWLRERAKLYEKKSLWQALKMIRFFSYYQRFRQYFGDIYIIFIKK
jgi:glycosyltransferase involved in cell wall biosynthesis